jgi:hypothetical protein
MNCAPVHALTTVHVPVNPLRNPDVVLFRPTLGSVLWIIVGIVAVWIAVCVVAGIWFGLALRTADIEDEVDRLRRDERFPRLQETA